MPAQIEASGAASALGPVCLTGRHRKRRGKPKGCEPLVHHPVELASGPLILDPTAHGCPTAVKGRAAIPVLRVDPTRKANADGLPDHEAEQISEPQRLLIMTVVLPEDNVCAIQVAERESASCLWLLEAIENILERFQQSGLAASSLAHARDVHPARGSVFERAANRPTEGFDGNVVRQKDVCRTRRPLSITLAWQRSRSATEFVEECHFHVIQPRRCIADLPCRADDIRESRPAASTKLRQRQTTPCGLRASISLYVLDSAEVFRAANFVETRQACTFIGTLRTGLVFLPALAMTAALTLPQQLGQLFAHGMKF